MERLSRRNLQTLEVDAVTAIKSDIALREIVADDANQLDRSEKTGGDGGMAGRTAEQARIFAVSRFDGVKRGGTNNENAHVFANPLSS